nr:hypothetical protein GCM10010200_021630 [Actinomadura rugatobispora]
MPRVASFMRPSMARLSGFSLPLGVAGAESGVRGASGLTGIAVVRAAGAAQPRNEVALHLRGDAEGRLVARIVESVTLPDRSAPQRSRTRPPRRPARPLLWRFLRGLRRGDR